MSTVLVPHRPPKSRAARLLGWTALPMLGLLAGIDALLTAMGIPGSSRPSA